MIRRITILVTEMPKNIQEGVDSVSSADGPLDALDELGRICINNARQISDYLGLAAGRRLAAEVQRFVGRHSPSEDPGEIGQVLAETVAKYPAAGLGIAAQSVLVWMTVNYWSRLDARLTTLLQTEVLDLVPGMVLPTPCNDLKDLRKATAATSDPEGVATELTVGHKALARHDPLGPSNAHAIGPFPTAVHSSSIVPAPFAASMPALGLPCLGAALPVGLDGIQISNPTEHEFLVMVDDRTSASRWNALTELVEGAGVNVLVGPEFQAPDDTTLDYLASLTSAVSVYGSRHIPDGDVWRNEASLFVAGKRVFRHNKVIPFQDDDHGSECIEGGSVLTIAHGDGWRACVLVCSDLNNSDLVQFVSSLKPNLILVPAWTMKAGAFPERLAQLGLNGQAMVVFANGPLPPDRQGLVPQAAFWRPLRPSSGVQVDQSIDPGLVVCCPTRKGFESIPLGSGC